MFSVGFFGQRSPVFIKDADAVNSIVIHQAVKGEQHRSLLSVPLMISYPSARPLCSDVLPLVCFVLSLIPHTEAVLCVNHSCCPVLKLLQPTYTSRERKIKTAGGIPGVSKSWPYTLA